MKILLIFWVLMTVNAVFGGGPLKDIQSSGVIVEGDIMLNENEDPWDRRTRYKSMEHIRWPNGTVPYELNMTEYSLVDMYIIQGGLKEIERDTCIQFVKRTNEIDYIFVTPNIGCWSYLGRKGSGQTLSLTLPQCINRGTVIHEFMHALGFWHEHSRPDRDEYVEVLWDNIIEDKQSNFDKNIGSWNNWMNFSYDYRSVMHYSSNAFSRSPVLHTLRPKNSQVRLRELGRAKTVGTLTELDKLKINAFYEC